MQKERLSLPEEFSLLLLVQNSGYFRGRIFQPVEFFTAASCMMELFYRGKLKEIEQSVTVIDSTRTGLSFLDAVMDTIERANKPRNLFNWLIYFSNKRLRTRQRIADHLVRRNILRSVETHKFLIFPVTHLVIVKPDVREEIVRNLREKMLDFAPLDEQTLGLFLLIKQSGRVKQYFSKNELTGIKYRLDRLQHEEAHVLSFRLAKMVNKAYKTVATPKWESYGV